jgi:transposase
MEDQQKESKGSGNKASRQRYSDAFKQQALLRGVKDGIWVVARDLGLQASQLYAWRAKQQGAGAEADRMAQAEVSRLKRELARLEQENAFLKKAAAYFAKGSS